MKRIAILVLVAMLLCSCSGNAGDLDRPMALRGKIQQKEVTFDVDITADYGDKTHTFAMQCHGDTRGNLTFTVTQPDSIAGISGTVSKGSGKLTFDNQALAFEQVMFR